MKANKIFVLIIVLIFGLGVLVQVTAPQPFNWEPTYHTEDKNPFGCYVFDSVMKHTMSKGYRVSRKTIYQESRENKGKVQNYIICLNEELTKVDISALAKLAKQGSRILLASNRYITDSAYKKTLHVGFYYVPSQDVNLRSLVLKSDSTELFDTLQWKGRGFPTQSYRIYSSLVSSDLGVDSGYHVDTLLSTMVTHLDDEIGVDTAVSSYSEALGYDNSQDSQVRVLAPLLISEKYGKGEILYCGTPLLFTNYGILDSSTQHLLMRMMSLMGDKPLVRINMKDSNTEELDGTVSPLDEFLKRPPLRWAIYTFLLGVLLFMIFTARRRQRIIPVVEKSENKSLEFVKLIGSVYYHRKATTDLVQKKYSFFVDEIYRQFGLDVRDIKDDEIISRTLSEKSGIEKKKIAAFIKELRYVSYLKTDITSDEMRDYIDKMNRILKAIR